MLAYILLILVLAVVVVASVLAFGLLFGRGEALPPAQDSAIIMEANRQAIAENRYGDVRLELSWRGYCPEQVDSLVEALLARQSQLEEKLATQEEQLADQKRRLMPGLEHLALPAGEGLMGSPLTRAQGLSQGEPEMEQEPSPSDEAHIPSQQTGGFPGLS